MNKNYAILGIEILGAAVILCVCLALSTSLIIFPDYMPSMWLIMYGMFYFAMATMTMTIYRSCSWISYKLLTVCGILLLLAGAGIAYSVPMYFHWAVNLNEWYWLRVSVYSIPAICIEGGIVTLFIVLLDTELAKWTKRARLLIVTVFVLYAVFTVTANFLSINRVMTVDSHILFSRIVSAVVMVFTAIVIIFKRSLLKKII